MCPREPASLQSPVAPVCSRAVLQCAAVEQLYLLARGRARMRRVQPTDVPCSRVAILLYVAIFFVAVRQHGGGPLAGAAAPDPVSLGTPIA